jgi:molecular chaperone DnaK
MAREIGIDFGTTNSVISFMKDGKVENMKFGREFLTPTVVFFKTENDLLFGENAVKKGLLNPRAMVRYFKPNIGKKDKILIKAEDGSEFEKSYKVIAKLFLNHLFDKANRWLVTKYRNDDECVSKAIITVPAKFSPIEKENIKWAANQSNIDVNIVFEPTAAAIAYNHCIDFKPGNKILIYDFGGGTFDVSIIEVKPSGRFEEIATNGNKNLGGNLLTQKIVDKYLLQRINDEFNLDLPSSVEDYDDCCGLSEEIFHQTLLKIYDMANLVKERLSDENKFTGDLTIDNGDSPYVLNIELKREMFESFANDEIQKTIEITKTAFENSGISHNDLTAVVLAGGSSNIPKIREKLIEHFGKSKVFSDRNVLTLISEGAAILANSHFSAIQNTVQQVPNDLGVKVNEKNILNKFDTLIEAGSKLPVSISKEYSLTHDNQETLEIEIYERDTKNYRNATQTMHDGIEMIDKLIIDDIPKMPKDDLKIKVKFSIEADGCMNLEVELLKTDGTPLKSENLSILQESNIE